MMLVFGHIHFMAGILNIGSPVILGLEQFLIIMKKHG
jgi:hypothetical protein